MKHTAWLQIRSERGQAPSSRTPLSARRFGVVKSTQTAGINPALARRDSPWSELATAAEIQGLSVGAQLADPVAAARAALAALGVHLHEAPVLLRLVVIGVREDRLDGPPEGGRQGAKELFLLLRPERRPAAQRQQPGLEQDLVGVGVADPGQEGLVAEQVLELIPVAPQLLSEPVQPEPADRVRLGPQLGPGRHLPRRVLDPVDPAHVAEVRVAQLLLALQPQREDPGRRWLGVSLVELEATSQHRIDDQAALTKVEDQVLAAPPHPVDAPGRDLAGEVLDGVAQQVSLFGVDL